MSPQVFGDWLALDGATETSFKGSTDDTYVASVYYCASSHIAGKAAGILRDRAAAQGDREEAGRYAEDCASFLALSAEIKDAILEEYFTPSGRLAVDTQTALILALQFGIFRDRETVVQQLKTRFRKDLYRIRGGFAGAPQMCAVLADNGMADYAYDFLFGESFPGWLYEVNLGATTIWERWNSVLPDGTIADNEMNSLNHYAYGSVAEFLYAYAAGIRPAAPGFRRAGIAPVPHSRLVFLSCRYDSAAGTYGSSWRIEADGSLQVMIRIPFGASAKVILPYDPEHRVLQLNAGEYRYSYEPDRDLLQIFTWDTRLGMVTSCPEALELLTKRMPMLAGMSHDPEMGANSFRDLLRMDYLPLNYDTLKETVEELQKIRRKLPA